MKKLERNYYSAEEVSYMFDMEGLVEARAIDALALLPKKVVDFVAGNCVILTMSLLCDGQHWNLDASIFKGKKSLLILSPELWRRNQEWPKVVFIIAHEVAHAYLKHSIWMCSGRKPRHEVAADILALKWLGHHWKINELTKFCAYFGRKF